MKTIYLDNAATTKVDLEVVNAMSDVYSNSYGNPSSLHQLGENSKKLLNQSRETIAKEIGAKSDEIIFTSGGTESDNLAIIGYCLSNQKKGKHIITSKIEHPAVLECFKYLSTQGFDVDYIGVDSNGFVSLENLNKLIREDTILISIMHANNEIGVVQDIVRIGNLCKSKNIIFHTDAVQSFTKEHIDVNLQNIDLLSISAHKVHGPKGVGALYVRKGINLTPSQLGGGQEKKIRSGTENLPGIVGFAKATELVNKSDNQKMAKLRDYMLDELSKIESMRINGSRKNRVSNNVHVSFDFVEGESLLLYLDLEGICMSTGSACSSSSLSQSHVLAALGRKPEESHGSLRITLSKYTTKEEIDFTINKIKTTVDKLRLMSPIKNKQDAKKAVSAGDDHHHH